jgi:hypothetical protein
MPKHQSLAVASGVTLFLAAYFGDRDRRFRERDRFGGFWRCAVLIVDFLR